MNEVVEANGVSGVTEVGGVDGVGGGVAEVGGVTEVDAARGLSAAGTAGMASATSATSTTVAMSTATGNAATETAASERVWLSRVRLNPRHADSAGAMRDAQALHALTMRCLAPGVARAHANLLHHADLGAALLFVQTTVEPVWPETAAFHAHTKEVTGFVDSIGPGERLRFTLRAVPMKRRSAQLRDGTAIRAPGEHPLRADCDRVAWLERHLATAARLVEPPFVTGEPDRVGTRRGSKFTLRPVRFDGFLDVIDADELRILVRRGVGRAKSYGNGMLILARNQG
ncbi:MAG TPA: type I-E CRISPR-associated protein Cas6/Cse3/CasE [Actinocrinis sp.]|nr:type I-E CRISPR-associated protein Cas6/Cse3/CasE [Actinocrinis sp.]